MLRPHFCNLVALSNGQVRILIDEMQRRSSLKNVRILHPWLQSVRESAKSSHLGVLCINIPREWNECNYKFFFRSLLLHNTRTTNSVPFRFLDLMQPRKDLFAYKECIGSLFYCFTFHIMNSKYHD